MENLNIIKFDLRIADNGRLPKREHIWDAGADVFAPYDFELEPHCTHRFPLGFGVQVKPGFYGKICERGSMAIKGISCAPNPIDADYTGQVHAVLTNHGLGTYCIKEGDKIGQLLIEPVHITGFITEDGEQAPIPTERRGTGAFGSTGK